MKRAVGIDVGNYSIKLIELENKKNHLEVTKCCNSRIVDGNIEATLRDMISLIRLTAKHVNISLSGPSVIVRYIEMPPMKNDELKSAIKFEAEKYIPFSIEGSIIDYATLDRTSTGSQRVALVAAKKSEVSNLLEFFKRVGLEVNAIDIDSFALLNSFQRLKVRSGGENTYALLNMGARYSNMNIITNEQVYFTRDILWGGMDVTNRIKDAMRISFQEAEELKKCPSEKREEVVGFITPTLERLVSQIRLSFDYFESQFGKTVEKLYISGGTAYLFNILDFLRENLGTATIMWNPFEGIRISDMVMDEEIKDYPCLFAVVMGLALRQ